MKHIQEFEDWNVEKPVLNQVDLHPFMRRQSIVNTCRKYGIVLEVSPPLLVGSLCNVQTFNLIFVSKTALRLGLLWLEGFVSTILQSNKSLKLIKSPLLRYCSDGESNMYVPRHMTTNQVISGSHHLALRLRVMSLFQSLSVKRGSRAISKCSISNYRMQKWTR